MAEIANRVPQNAPGRFYVDWTCIYCELCVEIAPALFTEHQDRGWAFVLRQPRTPEEEALCLEAVEACPTDSIGSDGAGSPSDREV